MIPFPRQACIAACVCCCAASGQETATHLSLARDVVDLLSETEACLNTCQNAATVQAALPRLEELAERARAIKAAQAALPNSTVQDDLAAAKLAGEFTLLWNAICRHISRLEDSGLMDGKLRAVLCVDPPQTEKAAPAPH